MTAFENPSEMDASKEQEIMERQEMVNELLSQGWTEKKIAEKLNVSYATILLDVKFLKEEALQWVDDLVKTEFIFEVKKSIGELNNLKTRLYGYLDDDKLDAETKVKISREIKNILDLKLGILAKGPALQGLRRAIKQHGNDPQTQPYNYNNKV